MWCGLDTQTDSGEHYYLAGVRTDAIIHPKVKAVAGLKIQTVAGGVV